MYSGRVLGAGWSLWGIGVDQVAALSLSAGYVP